VGVHEGLPRPKAFLPGGGDRVLGKANNPTHHVAKAGEAGAGEVGTSLQRRGGGGGDPVLLLLLRRRRRRVGAVRVSRGVARGVARRVAARGIARLLLLLLLLLLRLGPCTTTTITTSTSTIIITTTTTRRLMLRWQRHLGTARVHRGSRGGGGGGLLLLLCLSPLRALQPPDRVGG